MVLGFLDVIEVQLQGSKVSPLYLTGSPNIQMSPITSNGGTYDYSANFDSMYEQPDAAHGITGHLPQKTSLAAIGGRKGISLPSKGVDLEARSKDGTTALMFAAVYNENPEVLATLLDAGADAKAKNGRGNTAFDYARNNYSLRSTEAFRKLEEALQ